MAVEDDISATLKRIEALLKKTSATTGGVAGSGRAAAAGSGRNNNVFTATAKQLAGLGSAADGTSKSLNSLTRTVNMTRAAFIKMNQSARTQGRAAPTSKNQRANIPPAGGGRGGAPISNSPLTALLGNSTLARNLNGNLSKISYTSVAVASALAQLTGAIAPVAKDFFRLTARGLDASSSLGGLYIDAARAGMSLDAYTKALDEAGPAVARAASFDDFGKQLRATNSQLANLGIFGESASKLSATMAGASTTLGVPQAQLGNAIDQQVQTFAILRKSSMLTADGFNEIVKSLQDNQEVQSQLLGMNGQERSARLNELIQIQGLGLSMGSTKKASQDLGNAILEQRKLTAQQRFQSAGTIRQAGAITGMSADDTETLAGLSRKKNLTPEESAIATAIGGRLQAQIEGMLNSGNVNQEFIAEQLQERLNSAGIGRFLGAAGNVALTAQSGPVQNKDFGQGASDLVKGAGMLMTVASGLAQNPIAEAVLKAFGSSAFSLGVGALIGKSISKVPFFGRFFATAATAGGGAAATAGASGGVVSSVGSAAINLVKQLTSLSTYTQPLKSIGSAISSAVSGIVSILSQTGFGGGGFMSTISSLGANLSSSIMGGIGAVFKGAFSFLGKSGWLSALLGGVIELFTGDLGAALNGADNSTWLGDGLSGFSLKMVNKIGDVIGAMLHGFGTGFTGMADGLVWLWNNTAGKFFKDLQINMTSSFTNLFDITWTNLMIGFKELKLKAAKFFGMADWQKSLEDDIEVLKKSQASLDMDGKTTLTEIGSNNQKLLAKQQDAAKAATAGIQVATKAVGTAAGVITDTVGLTSTLQQTAASIVATPGTTPQASINTAPVNTTTDPTTQDPNALVKAPGTGVTPPVDQNTVLTSMLQVLTDILTVNRSQADSAARLASGTDTSRFQDNNLLISSLTKMM